MPTILACTDGSIYGASICQHTAWAAERMTAEVKLLHVIDHHRERTPNIDLSGAIGMDASVELTEELTKLEAAEGRVARIKGKAILEEAQRQLTAAGISNATATQRHGALPETLEELEPAVDLVVIGKRGEHADFEKGTLGDNLETVVRISVRPVLVASRAFKPIKRMLIAFDDSANARKVVDYVASQPLLRGLECELLMVGRADTAHETALKRAAEKLKTAGYTLHVELKPGSAVNVIAEEVKAKDIDLLVMGAFGHSTLREFILGSTTRSVVQNCRVPVLMFR